MARYCEHGKYPGGLGCAICEPTALGGQRGDPAPPAPLLVGVCRDGRLRLKQPLPMKVERDAETGQYVASIAREGMTDWGHGDSQGGAMEDCSDGAAETFRYLSQTPDDKLSPNLQTEKQLLTEYFEWRELAPPAPAAPLEFPIQNHHRSELEKGVKPGPRTIPWSVAEKAYSIYSSRYGTRQTLERLAERGGFSLGEMDDLYPEWRNETDELARAEAELERLREALRAVISHPAVREVLAPRESLGSLIALAEAALGEKGSE